LAHVIQSINHLESNTTKLRKRRLRWGVICVASILLAFPTKGITFITAILALIFISLQTKQINIYAAGLQGEQDSAVVFSNLPDTYTVLSDLEVEYDGKKSQLDTCVVGPTGVFIIENKNKTGHITGGANQHEWDCTKHSRAGHPYETQFYNPVKQVGTHVYRLSHYLKENGVHTWVQGVVYFSNPHALVEVHSDAIPVFSAGHDGAQRILQFIQDSSKHSVSSESHQRIVQTLERCIVSI